MNVLVVDDHPLIRAGIGTAIKPVQGRNGVRNCASLKQALHVVRRSEEPKTVFLDLGLPDSRGLVGLLQLRLALPNASIVVISGQEHPDLRKFAFLLGAKGFVKKAWELELINNTLVYFAGPETHDANGSKSTIDTRIAPAFPPKNAKTLTPRELDVLHLMCDGLSNISISKRLGVTEPTIKRHINRIFDKGDVRSRTQLVQAVTRSYRGLSASDTLPQIPKRTRTSHHRALDHATGSAA